MLGKYLRHGYTMGLSGFVLHFRLERRGDSSARKSYALIGRTATTLAQVRRSEIIAANLPAPSSAPRARQMRSKALLRNGSLRLPKFMGKFPAEHAGGSTGWRNQAGFVLRYLLSTRG